MAPLNGKQTAMTRRHTFPIAIILATALALPANAQEPEQAPDTLANESRSRVVRLEEWLFTGTMLSPGSDSAETAVLAFWQGRMRSPWAEQNDFRAPTYTALISDTLRQLIATTGQTRGPATLNWEGEFIGDSLIATATWLQRNYPPRRFSFHLVRDTSRVPSDVMDSLLIRSWRGMEEVLYQTGQTLRENR